MIRPTSSSSIYGVASAIAEIDTRRPGAIAGDRDGVDIGCVAHERAVLTVAASAQDALCAVQLDGLAAARILHRNGAAVAVAAGGDVTSIAVKLEGGLAAAVLDLNCTREDLAHRSGSLS